MHKVKIARFYTVLCVLCEILTCAITDDLRVTNFMVATINSTALKATWSGPTAPDVTSYSIVVEDGDIEVASYDLTMNIGTLPNYTDQELIIGRLSPFTTYNVTVTASTDCSLLTPSTEPQTTLMAGPSGVPINVTLLVVSYQQINVSWSIDVTTVNGILLYFNIYYYTAAGYSHVVVYNATDNSIGPYTMSVTGLSPNTLYSINVTIVNEVSEGSHSSAVQAETHPTAPDNNLITTVSPTQISTNTIQIYVPTQQIFTTADIAVIYVIADSNSPPLFSSYTANQRYNSVVRATSGVVNVAATLRIQALLDASYYNQQTDYVPFNVGDGGTFLFNGLAVDNIPLRFNTEYQISYYILFYNADGQISPDFTYYDTLDTFKTLHHDICLPCFLIPICAFVAILFILVVVCIVFIHYYMWDKRDKLTRPSPVVVSSKKESVKATDSLVIYNKDTRGSSVSHHTSIYKPKV